MDSQTVMSSTKVESLVGDAPSSRLRTIYLEITSRTQLRPAVKRWDELVITRVARPFPEFNRFLYAAAGFDWLWTDRLQRTREQWLAYLDRPELETWIGYQSGAPAAYFELEAQPGLQQEIRIFGVMPFAVGKGIGGRMLSFAAERGFDRGARRVWLHTCNRDHPHALGNYLARGFRIYSIVEQFTAPPKQPVWPG